MTASVRDAATLPGDLLAVVSETLATARDLDQLTRPLLELMQIVTGLESTYLTRIDLAAGLQSVLFSRNSKQMQIPEGLSVPWGDTLCKRALDEGRGFTDDVAACWGDSEAARALGIRTYASTPVYLEDGALYGTLCAASSDRRPFSETSKQTLALFSTLIAQHIQRERLLEQLRQANAALEGYSFHDALTGLPNRRFALMELSRLQSDAARTGRRIVLAYIDLDGFKAINDTFGHEVGDAFLVEVARRLSAGLEAGEVAGRLGGDEFVVMATEAGEPGSGLAGMLRDRLAPLLAGRYELAGAAFDYPGASLGVLDADPEAATPEDMLRRADALMYAEKRLRRSGGPAG